MIRTLRWPGARGRQRLPRRAPGGILLVAMTLTAASCGRVAGIPPLPPPPHPAVRGPAVAQIQRAGLLRVASDLSYPPMEFWDGRTPRGFEMDLASLLAAALGVHLEVIDTPLAVMRAGFPRGADLLLSALSRDYPTGLHSDPYYVTSQAILSPGSAPVRTLEMLQGLRVAVQAGSPGAAIARRASAGVLLTAYLPGEALSAVAAGRAHAAVGERPLVAKYAQDHPGLYVATGPWGEVPLVVVVRQDAPELAAFVSAALRELTQNGGLGQLRRRWNL